MFLRRSQRKKYKNRHKTSYCFAGIYGGVKGCWVRSWCTAYCVWLGAWIITAELGSVSSFALFPGHHGPIAQLLFYSDRSKTRKKTYGNAGRHPGGKEVNNDKTMSLFTSKRGQRLWCNQNLTFHSLMYFLICTGSSAAQTEPASQERVCITSRLVGLWPACFRDASTGWRERSRTRATAALGQNTRKVGSCRDKLHTHKLGHYQTLSGPGDAQSLLASVWLILSGITVPVRRKRRATAIKMQRTLSAECCSGPHRNLFIF